MPSQRDPYKVFDAAELIAGITRASSSRQRCQCMWDELKKVRAQTMTRDQILIEFKKGGRLLKALTQAVLVESYT